MTSTTTSEGKKSFVIRYLGPLVPLGFAAVGVWILLSGAYTYRPGRTSSTVTLLPPDSHLAGLFFISLGVLIAAFGVSGRRERWFFWGGLSGALLSLVVEGTRQILRMAVYG
ncbi:hypothetical protein NU688_13870 [Variovorax sp. ZS18.2.2]|uniref:hypothetical protein n=1 Tax=Variovorax sp. ZS18.2.2 TaxID=2971255 RepID=UPI002151C51A|nr:hypothetical protein [Variovorax sp. ZS18.2.2]MCR6477243.1 hypothetical protein [Variovorax sp. ZS18.2.2]